MANSLGTPFDPNTLDDSMVGKRIFTYGRIAKVTKKSATWDIVLNTPYGKTLSASGKKKMFNVEPTLQSYICFDGIVQKTPKFEIKINHVVSMSQFEPGDLQVTTDKLEVFGMLLRGKESQRMLVSKYQDAFYVASAVRQALRKISSKLDLHEVSVPLITFSKESGDRMKVVPEIKGYFPKTAYLATEDLSDLETIAQRLCVNCYSLERKYRPRTGKTENGEQYHYDIVAHTASLSKLRTLLGYVFKQVIKCLLGSKTSKSQLTNLGANIEELEKYTKDSIPYLSYEEATELLKTKELTPDKEKDLCKVKGVVIVHSYPASQKPYSVRLGKDDKTSETLELLVPGIGSIAKGYVQEGRYEFLLKQLKDRKLPEKDHAEYLALKKEGGTNTISLNLNVDGLVMFLTGVNNNRDITPFPRHYKK